MTDDAVLKKCLSQAAGLREAQLYQAEDYALTRDIPLDEALLFLELVDFEQLGRCLAKIHKKPYLPLIEKAPARETLDTISDGVAERLTIFPVRSNPAKGQLVLAASDPDDPLLHETLESLLPSFHKIEFGVASAPEIKRAIDIHYRDKTFHAVHKIEVPEGFVILPEKPLEDYDREPEKKEARKRSSVVMLEPDSGRSVAIRSLLKSEGYERVAWALSPKEAGQALVESPASILIVNGSLFRPHGTWLSEVEKHARPARISYYEIEPFLLGQEHSYQQMSDALIGMVSHQTRVRIGNNVNRLRRAVERAKYCKLLAVRMDMARSQVDATVLAAWLSCSPDGRETAAQVPTPFKLDTILNGDGTSKTARREAQVLRLVAAYQKLVSSDPETARDLTRVRAELQKIIADVSEEMLESLLRLIREEEFLGQVKSGIRGQVLIVDRSASLTSPLPLRLCNEGYWIDIAATGQQALAKLLEGDFDLVVSEADLEEGDGLKLCRILKDRPETAGIPLIFFADEDKPREHASYLEAGAEDYLVKPLDMDIVTLKIKRLIGAGQGQRATRGVRGSLEEMSSVDFLQSLSAGEKDVEVRLESSEAKGKIYIQQGQVVHAELGNVLGEEALYELVGWETGGFEILACADFPEQTIHAPLESLLIEAFRRVDESRSQESEDVE